MESEGNKFVKDIVKINWVLTYTCIYTEWKIMGKIKEKTN